MPNTDRRTKLVRVLAEIDGIIAEARDHVADPDDDDSRRRAAKIVAELEPVRDKVEAMLQAEK